MRSVKLAAMVALVAGGLAFGQSTITYTLELNGNPNARHVREHHERLAQLHARRDERRGHRGQQPPNMDLNGGRRVRVRHASGCRRDPASAWLRSVRPTWCSTWKSGKTAPLVATLGAAPLALTGEDNLPTAAGFWTPSMTATATARAPTRTLWPTPPSLGASTTRPCRTAAPGQLDDPATNTVPGPNFDYGWFPTALNRGGIQIGTANTPRSSPRPPRVHRWQVIGFGAATRPTCTDYLPGVGMRDFDPEFARPTATSASAPPLPPERGLRRPALVRGLTPGTYTLKVVPSADGNNILHGSITWYDEAANAYGGSQLRRQGHAVAGSQMDFTVAAPILNPTVRRS